MNQVLDTGKGIFHHWRLTLDHALRLYRVGRDRFGIKGLLGVLFLFFLSVNISCYWLGIHTAFPELLENGEYDYYFKIQFPVSILGAAFDSFSFFATVYIIICALNSKTRKAFLGFLSLDLVIATIATLWVLFVFNISGWAVSYLDDQIVTNTSQEAQIEIEKTKAKVTETSGPTSQTKIDAQPKDTSSEQISDQSQEQTPEQMADKNNEPKLNIKAKSQRTFSERVKDYENLVDEIIENPEHNFRSIYFGLLMGLSTLIPTLLHLLMAFNSIFRVILEKVKKV
jgi:hypothetical protein